MDIVTPIPKASSNMKFLLVAIDYFTKWIEAESLVKITEPMVEKFAWRNIITRFGIPFSIIAGNGPQFQKKSRAFCAQYKIRNYYSMPPHPLSNEQAEVSNMTILGAIKKQLDKRKGKWPDEVPLVFWSYQTMPRSST